MVCTPKNPIRKPELLLLGCLIATTAVAEATFVLAKNLVMMDVLFSVLLVVSAFIVLGNALTDSGKIKTLEFGAIAGRYIRLVSVASGWAIFLVIWALFCLFSTTETRPINWPFFTIIAVLGTLLVIAFGIIEKLLTAQKSHREECAELRRKLAATNQRTAQQRLQALSYDHAWRKLRDDIAGEEGLSGNDVIHRFRLGIDEYRETLRTKRTNKPNKQTRPNA